MALKRNPESLKALQARVINFIYLFWNEFTVQNDLGLIINEVSIIRGLDYRSMKLILMGKLLLLIKDLTAVSFNI